MEELPELKKLDSIYGKKGLQILGISLDTNIGLWKGSIVRNNIPWVNLSDLQGADNIAARLLNINAIPAQFLIDPKGKILMKNTSLYEMKARIYYIFE